MNETAGRGSVLKCRECGKEVGCLTNDYCNVCWGWKNPAHLGKMDGNLTIPGTCKPDDHHFIPIDRETTNEFKNGPKTTDRRVTAILCTKCGEVRNIAEMLSGPVARNPEPGPIETPSFIPKRTAPNPIEVGI